MFSSNPSIFIHDYDYEMMKNSYVEIKEEIVAMALNPVRIANLMSKYGREIVYNNYFS